MKNETKTKDKISKSKTWVLSKDSVGREGQATIDTSVSVEWQSSESNCITQQSTNAASCSQFSRFIKIFHFLLKVGALTYTEVSVCSA